MRAFGTVFDERYYLYGVDTTFFLRFNNLNCSDKARVIKGFNHSLSRLEIESSSNKRFRKVERSYDLGLTLRYYRSCREIIFDIVKVFGSSILKMILKRENAFYLRHVFIALLVGKHYRDK